MLALTFPRDLQRSWSVCFCSSLGIDGSLENAGPGSTAKIKAATKPVAVARARHRRISPVIGLLLTDVSPNVKRCAARRPRSVGPQSPHYLFSQDAFQQLVRKTKAI